ncbi:MAG: universal stress protein [Bacteroidetes bacterium]|nr:universal stress protein [Bacteroidota bacterium]
MRFIKQILVATDFTKSSDNLFESALQLAGNFKARISIIHVFPGGIKDAKTKVLLEEAANSNMKKIVQKIEAAGVEVRKTYLREGNCTDNVVRTAERINANLIMIGSSEDEKNDLYKLGTTAEKIIRRSEQPVWVVKKDGAVSFKTIFCPVDFSDESKRAIQDAAYLAHSFKSKLIIFSVYELYDKSYPRFDPEAGGMNELVRKEHESELEEFLEGINLIGLVHDIKIAAGDPAKEINKSLRSHKPDLLVMGTTGKTGLSRWIMGSVTEKVIREVPCSFITLKSESTLSPELESRVLDLEYHIKAARELFDKNLFQEAIEEFSTCLKINDMHIPSLVGISKAYEALGNDELAKSYRRIATSTLDKMWESKIESEVRKFYGI